MARSYSLREGFASPDRKWLVGKERSYVRKFKDGDEMEVKYHGLMRDDGSPQRVSELDRLREQSAVKIPVYRGQPAFESLDKKAMKKAVKEGREEMSWRQKKDSVYYGGGGMFHFSADIDHARDYVETDGGVVEGVILAKSMLDLRKIGSEPSGYQPAYGSDKTPSPMVKEFREKEKNEDKYKYLDEVSKRFDDGGVYDVVWKNSGDDGRNLVENASNNTRVARFIDNAVKTMADAYQAKFGKPMPQDIHISGKPSKDKRFEERQAELLKRNDYAALRNALWEDKKFNKGPFAYMLLQTAAIKNLIKKADFDVVAYNDIINSGDQLESYAVMKPNQFKAYAGDKKVNLKSNNMFDAD